MDVSFVIKSLRIKGKFYKRDRKTEIRDPYYGLSCKFSELTENEQEYVLLDYRSMKESLCSINKVLEKLN